MTTMIPCRQASVELIVQAGTELQAGDLRQASEKGWGAAAQIVKAVGQHREWDHGGHGLLFGIVGNIVKETGDNQKRDLFHIASALHQNFYEMWLYREDVEAALANVRLFITKVDATFPPNESPGD